MRREDVVSDEDGWMYRRGMDGRREGWTIERVSWVGLFRD